MCAMLLLPLAVLAQENDGRIDFDADIFTGKAKAYKKKTSAIFFENVYFELGGSVGKDTGQLGIGYNVGLTIGSIRFRPWCNENMFSIGWGFESEFIKAERHVSLATGQMSFGDFPSEWNNPKSWLSVLRFTIPLTYARDVGNNWTFYLTFTPSFSFPGKTDSYKTDKRFSTSTLMSHPCFDCALSLGGYYNGIGLFVKYKPNLMWRHAYEADIQTISAGIIITH